MLLTHFFNDFYRPLRLRGRSQNTTRLYHCTIRAFGRWLGTEPTLDDLTDLTLARYLDARAAVRSPFTAEKERTQLLALWRLACDRGVMRDRPCVPPTPLPDREPMAWSIEQMQGLMRAAAATRGDVGGVPAGVWFSALVSVLWESAERIGAMLAVQRADLNPPHLLVRAEHRKGGKRDRVYRLSPRATELLLAAHAPGRPELLFWPGCRTYLWRRYADVVARAGLGRGRHLGFHQLRRSAASHFAALGGDASKLLDHSSPRITQRWYLDRRMTDLTVQPCDLLPAIQPRS